jgi:oligopeptide transport system substrate-binding protein
MALALSFDKQDIADNIIKNGALAANFAVPTAFAYDENGVSFREAANAAYLETNKELALEYYEKAKEELGEDKFTITLGYQNNETRAAVAQYIQQDIQNTLPGVTVNLAVEDMSAGRATLKAGDFQIYLNVWNGDYQDATTFLDMWMTGNSYNYGRWSSEEYDSLLKDSYNKDSLDPQARIKDLADAEAALLNDVGIIPIIQPTNAYLINSDFDVPWCTKGFRWDHAVKKN